MCVTPFWQFLMFLAIAHAAWACGPRESLSPYARAPSLPADCEPYLLDADSPVPRGARYLGHAFYGDTGFSRHCGELEIREMLRRYACSSGADAVRLVEEEAPDFVSTCYRMTAELYRLGQPMPPGTFEVLVQHPESVDD
jgi:hypothetical protein